MRRTALWILAAVAGVLVVAGVTLAASTLSTQTIGLSSEPLTAGDELAPRETATPAPDKPRKREHEPHRSGADDRTGTPTSTPSSTDDHGGRTDDHSGSNSSGSTRGGSGSSGGGDDSGHGGGSGHGGDDD
jgi:uncharacterized membrane protein YgcG